MKKIRFKVCFLVIGPAMMREYDLYINSSGEINVLKSTINITIIDTNYSTVNKLKKVQFSLNFKRKIPRITIYEILE